MFLTPQKKLVFKLFQKKKHSAVVKSAISSSTALPLVTECLFSMEVGMDKGDLGTEGSARFVTF